MIPLRHEPAPEIEVRAGRDGAPLAFRWRRRWWSVSHCEAQWAFVRGWWQDDVQNRAYYRLEARGGLRCVVFRDGETGRWHLHSTLD